LPGAGINSLGDLGTGAIALWWSSTSYYTTNFWNTGIYLRYDGEGQTYSWSVWGYTGLQTGLSVRCVKE